MGYPIPEEPFEIDPSKNYRVDFNNWFEAIPEACSGGQYEFQNWNIILGADIIAWIEADKECTYDILYGPPGLKITQRIITIVEA